jgi:hypothetical protein
MNLKMNFTSAAQTSLLAGNDAALSVLRKLVVTRSSNAEQTGGWVSSGILIVIDSRNLKEQPVPYVFD